MVACWLEGGFRKFSKWRSRVWREPWFGWFGNLRNRGWVGTVGFATSQSGEAGLCGNHNMSGSESRETEFGLEGRLGKFSKLRIRVLREPRFDKFGNSRNRVCAGKPVWQVHGLVKPGFAGSLVCQALEVAKQMLAKLGDPCACTLRSWDRCPHVTAHPVKKIRSKLTLCLAAI